MGFPEPGLPAAGQPLHPEEEYPEEQVRGEAEEASYRAVLDAAVRSLARREHGRRELERKLKARGHAPQLITRALDYLVDQDLLSDHRFAEAFVRSRVRKGYGPVKIRQELAGRGIDEQLLEAQLTRPQQYWLEIARAALEKKFGRHDQDRDSRADRQEVWTVQARFLARRGFPSDLIYRLLDSRE